MSVQHIIHIYTLRLLSDYFHLFFMQVVSSSNIFSGINIMLKRVFQMCLLKRQKKKTNKQKKNYVNKLNFFEEDG